MINDIINLIQPVTNAANSCHAIALDISFDLENKLPFEIYVGELEILDLSGVLIRKYLRQNNGHAWIVVTDSIKNDYYVVDYNNIPNYKSAPFIEMINSKTNFEIKMGDYFFKYTNGILMNQQDLVNFINPKKILKKKI